MLLKPLPLFMAGDRPKQKRVGKIKKIPCVGLGKRKIHKGKGWDTYSILTKTHLFNNS